jgi:hypothetical protein
MGVDCCFSNLGVWFFPVKIGEAEELQRGRDVAKATYQADKVARITAARKLARDNWWLHISMN